MDIAGRENRYKTIKLIPDKFQDFWHQWQDGEEELDGNQVPQITKIRFK